MSAATDFRCRNPILWLVLLLVLIQPIPSRGNGEDGHQFPHIEAEDAVLYGLWFIEQFVARGEIDASWQGENVALQAELLELITGPEWVVTAHNARSDRFDRIQIYFGPMGQYLGWEPDTGAAASDKPGGPPRPAAAER